MNNERVIVSGDRNWTDREFVRQVLLKIQPGVVIHGAAPGVDTIAGEEAGKLNIRVVPRPAWWTCKDFENEIGLPCQLPDGRHEAVHGRPAGSIRNQRMIDEESPDSVVLIHNDLDNSKGTRNMGKRAIKSDLLVLYFSYATPDGVSLKNL